MKHRELIHYAITLQLLGVCWSWNYSVLADNGSASNTANNNNGNNSTSSASSVPSNLDLSSTSATISASQFAGSNISITAGGIAQQIAGTESLTPAQYLAALQVMGGGANAQTLVLSAAGNAVGGTFSVPGSIAGNLTALNVPTGVSAVYDFAIAQNLNLTGNLINSGNIYAVSSSQSVTSGMFSALNIVNNQGALLTSVLPTGGLSGFSNLLSSLNLTLNAINSISNYGTISSSGSLTMTAGNSIVNTSISSNVLASISAVNAVNMMAANISNQGQITSALRDVLIQTTNMTNSGLIQSMRGSVEIRNLLQNTLSINNIAGTISADKSLNVLNTVRGGEINVSGGKLLADDVNFTASRGTVHVAVEDITSDVNFSTRNVTLGVAHGTHGLNLTGVNKAYSVGLSYNGCGDIVTTGFRTRGQDVSLITSNGSITATKNIVTTPASSGNGGNVFVSALGGEISMLNIDTRGAKNGSGGKITLLAGEDITARTLNSSSGSTGGAPGVISIYGGLSGHGDVRLTSARAGRSGGEINISAPDLISVTGALNAPNGKVNLSAAETKIGKINVGSGDINIIPSGTGTFVLQYTDLVSFGEANVVIGSSGNVNADIVINNNCNNCLHNIDSLEINTNGSFTATGTTLSLDPDMSFVINAASGIYTGSVEGGSLVSFVTGGNLVVDGTINTAAEGSVVLGGANISITGAVHSNDVTLVPGSASTNISGTSLSNINASSITIGTGLSGQGVILTGTADLTNVSSFDVNLSGNFNASGSTLNLANDSVVSINAGNIVSGTITGANQVTLEAPGTLVVAGTINAPDVVLSGGTIGITGGIVSQTVQLLPYGGAATIDATGFSNVVADTLSIGNGSGLSNVTLTGSASLAHVNNFEVNLGGSFDGRSSNLTFSENTNVEISGANVSVGGLSGSASVSLSSASNLVIAGAVESQQVILSGGNIGIPGSVTAPTVSITPGSANTIIDAAGLGNVNTELLTIGTGSGNNGVTISGSGNLTGVGELSVSLGNGNFDSHASNLVLNDAAVTVSAGNIVVGGLSGASLVVLESRGTVDVQGQVNAGQVTVAGGGIDISGGVAAGTVLILPTNRETSVSAAGLSNIVADQVTIGNGQSGNSVSLIGQGNLSGIDNFIVNLGGNYNGGSSTITFDSDASVSVSAQNIISGGMTGATEIVLSTPGNLTVAGPLTADNMVLGGSQIRINDTVSAGSGTVLILPGVATTLAGSDLAHIDAGVLTIGNGTGSVTLTGTTDLSGVSTEFNVNLGNGRFDAGDASITLNNGTAMTVNAGDVYAGSINGAAQITLTASDELTISGALSTANGAIILGGNQLSISGSIDSGSAAVVLVPGANTLALDAAQLSHITGGSLQIGNGLGGQSVQISGTGSLDGVSGALVVYLPGGAFDAGSSQLTLNGASDFSVTAGQAATGGIEGVHAVNVRTSGALTVGGNINASGAVNLSGDRSGSGASVQLGKVDVHATNVSITSGGGDIVTEARIDSVGAIQMESAAGVQITDSATLSAGTDIRLQAMSTVSIGSDGGSGAVISAGKTAVNPFSSTEPVNSSSITGSGSVLIDTYRNGTGSGDIVIGTNTALSAAGTGAHPGDVGLLSAVDITIAGNASLSAVGGDLWLSAGDDISVGPGTRLTSVAVSNGPASVIQGTPVPAYTGGGIAVLAGSPQTNVPQLLASMVSARTATNVVALPQGNAWGGSNQINASGGSNLTVVFPAAAPKSVTNSEFVLSGGVVYLDPPDAGNSVAFNGVTVRAVAPRIIADTPILPPVIGGGNAGNTGNTGGVTLPAGSILSSSPILSSSYSAGSVTSSDLTTASGRRESLSFSGFSTMSLNGPSAFPSDTLENENNPKKQNNVRQAVFCTAPVVLKPKERVDDDSWIVASSSCQPFTFEAHDGSLIVGSGPAKFAPAAERTLLLKEGKILVMTVDKIHIVRTPICTATIPVNTAVIIEYQPDGAAFVTNLAGGKASVTLCKNDETCILSAAPGEQMILADSECPDEKIQGLSYAGVMGENVKNWHVELSGLRGRKMSFDRQELALQEWLLSCSNRCVNQAQLRRIQQLMQSMNVIGGATTLKSMVPSSKKGVVKNIASSRPAPEEYSPVGYVTGGMAAPVHINTLGAPTATVRYCSKSSVGMEASGVLNFTDGEIMVAATHRTLVKAGPALIHFSPGAVAVLSMHNGMLKVRNVYEKSGTAIKACIPGRKCLGVQAGQEIILGPKGLSLSKALSDEPVGRRRLTSVDLPSGHTFICSEISLSSFMQNSPVLSQVMRSGNPADRALAEKILKMAVCLSVVTSSHGNYSITSQ